MTTSSRLTRRSLLQVAGGVAGVAVPLGAVASTTTVASCAAPIDGRDVEPVQELAAFLVDSEPGALLRGCIGRIEGGMSAQRIAAATAVACARSFTPSVPDANLHVLYATDATFSLGADAPFRETLEILLWGAHRFKTAQLGEPEAQSYPVLLTDALPPLAEAAAKLEEACAERDEALAEQSALRLLRANRRAELLEVLARAAAAEEPDAVHKIIHVRHFASLLELVGSAGSAGSDVDGAELLTRCCARSVASEATTRARVDRTIERVRALDAGTLLAGTERNDEPIAALLATLRVPDADDAIEAVIDALGDGVHVDIVWDALLVAAADQMASGNFGAGRHHLTGTAAHRITSSWLRSDSDRLVHLLQATAMLTSETGGDAAAGIDVIEPIETARVEDAVNALPFDVFSLGEPEAARRALGFLEGDGDVAALLEGWRQRVFQYTDQDFHEVKMLHTVKREAARITPSWRNRFVACAFLHAPPATRSEWPGHGDVRAALDARR